MTGREIALATLHREKVEYPCFTQGFITASEYYTRLNGHDYWENPEASYIEFVRRTGANLIIQWYYPLEGQHRLEMGQIMHDPHPWEAAGFHTPEDVVRYIETLPDDEQVERDYNIEAAADGYAATIKAHQDLLGEDALVIDGFGQADFMGGYNIFGYENYLSAAAWYPEALRRYYHHTALVGRLGNFAIVEAIRKYNLPPFVYTGQDICGANGPLMSPTMLRDLYFPELKWCMEPLMEADTKVIWHCDGNIMPILDDLMDLGVSGLQGFEEEHGVDYAKIVKLKDPHGQPIIVLGCVSVVSTLPFGTVEDVKSSVERSFTLAGPERGFVLSTTSSTLPGTPFENIDAYFSHAKDFGREFLGG